ncbi:MAG: 3-dehydroquinate synthase [Cyclobacteriaceae bacterium]|nr:3-dehydroquinate synthase [Cyclobacteriaceae bacterium]MDW8331997.1 3-dehydroquinate synthase [Cyclobacteriaceae bacterium]
MTLPDHILITITPGPDLRAFLDSRGYSSIFVLTDENTAHHCYSLIRHELPPHVHVSIPAGEIHKTMETCMQVWKAMTDARLDRRSVVVVLGGGMPGDLGGFCAATFKRGIDFVLVPTTLLAQADASIGGKLGIDFESYKNHIGVFRQPALTLISSVFLQTLPEAELRSGFAEIVKHALISDREWWEELSSRPWKTLSWQDEVKRSAAFKWSIVSEDPHEEGLRKILNAGHTIGHAIESWFLSAGKPVLHGEAVAAGLICEAFISKELNLLTESDFKLLKDYLLTVFGKLSWPEEESDTISRLCYQDKKNQGKKIRMALLHSVGRAVWDYSVEFESISRALNEYRAL